MKKFFIGFLVGLLLGSIICGVIVYQWKDTDTSEDRDDDTTSISDDTNANANNSTENTLNDVTEADYYSTASNVVASTVDSMSANEKTMYNQAITQYNGDNVAGANVKSLIDQVITTNQGRVGQTGVFVAITTSGFTNTSSGYANTTLGDAGSVENDSDYVDEWSQAMTALKADVNIGKRYVVTTSIGDTGLVTLVTITEQ